MSTLGTYSAGSTNWIAPFGVTSVKASMWGGGGAGGGATGTKSAGGGGAGGAFVISTIGVSQFGTYPLVVGGGGVGGTLATTPPGGSTWIGAVGSAYAPGGIGGTRSTGANAGSQGGAGGTTGAIGTFAFAGGNGGNGVGGAGTGALAGAGGGGAADTGVGGNASGSTPGTGANTGGGAGGAAGGTVGAAGGVGATFGGGGGGGFSNNTTDRFGGTGGAGQMIIEYTEPSGTFGYTTKGATYNNWGADMDFSKYTFGGTTGTYVGTLWCYFGSVAAASNNKAVMGIYQDWNWVKLTQTEEKTGLVVGWQSKAIIGSFTLFNGSVYWLSVHAPDTNGGQVDSGAAGQHIWKSQAYGTSMPSPISTWSGTSAEKSSVFLEYSEPAPPGTAAAYAGFKSLLGVGL